METAKPEAMARFIYEHKDDEESKQHGPVARAKSDLRLHAAAIARWDAEGGASQALEQQKIAKTHEHRALWITDGEQEDT